VRQSGRFGAAVNIVRQAPLGQLTHKSDDAAFAAVEMTGLAKLRE
jgi:hypothetical protein